MKECREEHNKLLNISYNCEVGIVCNEEQYFCCNKYFRTNKNNIAYTIVGNYWQWLKRKLKQEKFELMSTTHGFKFNTNQKMFKQLRTNKNL